MQTLAICTWHAKPQLLLEQIINYNIAFDGEVTHLININADFHKSFWLDAKKLNISFENLSNVHFVDNPVRTYYAGIAHAFFTAVQEALRKKIAFDYIYWHTASDLLVKPGINNHISKFDLGFGTSHGVDLHYKKDHRGLELPNFEVENPSTWLQNISQDHNITRALRSMNMDRLYKSRSEGCFFRREIFFELMFPLNSNLSVHEMSAPPKPYPLEEYLFAQCVEFFCERNSVRRTCHAVSTSKAEKNVATIAEIEEVYSRPDKFGIKRFSPDIHSEERPHIRKTLSINNFNNIGKISEPSDTKNSI